MYADPQSVTINTVAVSLPRTSSGVDSGKFASSDRSHFLSVNHTYGRRVRHQIRIQKDSLTANPLISGQNVNQSMSCFIVVDLPAGYDTTAAKQVVDGFVAYLAASSGSAVTKLLGGES